MTANAGDLPQSRKTIWTRVVDWLIQQREALLGVALVLTVLAWPWSQRLKFDQSIESLYAEEDPHLRDFLSSRNLFGGDEFLIIAYSEPNLFQPDSNALTDAASARIGKLAERLSQVPGVAPESTQHLAQALKFPYGRERIRDLVHGTLLGDDDRTTAIVLRLKPEAESPVTRGDTIARIREVAAEHTPPAMVVGEPAQIHDMFRYVEDDGRKLFSVSLALLAVVLLLLLQRLRWVVLPLAVVLVSNIWTQAILVISGLRLSMVSSMLSSLITVIGVAEVTHVSLYFREQRRSLPPLDALRKTMSDLAAPVWWSVATTAFGFVVLVSSHINPVASFGMMMALGSLVVLMAGIVLIPGGILFGSHPDEPPPSATDRRVAAMLGRITLWVEHHPQIVMLVSVSIVALTSLGLLWLRVETDFSKNFRAHSPIVQSLNFVESRLGGAGSWEVNFPAPRQLTPEFLEKIRQFSMRLRTEFGVAHSAIPLDRPTLESNESHPTSFTAGKLSKVIALTDGLDLIPDKLLFKSLSLETRLGLLSNLQGEFVGSLYNSTSGRMRILLRAYERQPSETKLRLIADVEQLARQAFPDVTATEAPHDEKATFHETSAKSTGLFVLLTFLIESLLSDQWTSSILAAAGITTMMCFAFRSLAVGLMSLVPNLIPNVLVIGTMGWVGLPINIATAMIACVSMGLTVDSSIHYIAAYRRVRADGKNVYEALRETHKEVGRAVVYANLALMAGFGVLSLSHFIPLVYFGLLVSLAMFGGLIGNLVFLPLMIGWWDGRHLRAKRPTSELPLP